MTETMKQNGKNAFEMFKVIAQFLIIPTIALVWAIWTTMDVVKERVIRMDVTLATHISDASSKFSRMDRDAGAMTGIGQKLTILEHDIIEIKSQLKEVGAQLDAHRQKSDYDKRR